MLITALVSPILLQIRFTVLARLVASPQSTVLILKTTEYPTNNMQTREWISPNFQIIV